ncbi:MAG TPA: LPS assembly protein LptD [Verrucomicrobiae bacterium]|nr:LPS assembly protein LptD [Verrucomicrobiae bacterium]
MRPLLRLVLLTALASVWLGAPPGWAQRSAGAPNGGVTVSAGGEEASVVADQIQQVGGTSDLLIAVGNVEITRGQSRLLADRVELNRDTGQAVAQGKVVFYDGPDRLVGERIDYNLKTGTGVVYNGSAVSAPYYHLSAERMDRVGDSVYEVRRGVFTTCEGDDPAWSFHFDSGNADLDDIVYGRDASFWIKSVPVLPWVPFFAAALRRERQSGFLFPEFGQSSRKGFFTRVPYFWAIDDSQDLTVTLDAFSQRGLGLEGQYRYVLSREQRGDLNVFGVNEALRNDAHARVPENRGLASFHHDWQITPRLSFKVNANVVSDDLILRDYGNRLPDRATQRAETNVFVTQVWDAWSLVGNVKWYQDLTTPRPIELQRVPDIQLVGIRQPLPGVPGVLYENTASFVNFIRDVGPDGVRADFHPRLLMPIPVGGLITVTPFAGGRLTYYDQRVVGERLTRAGALLVQESVYDPRVRRQVEWGADVESRVSRVYTTDGSGSVAAYQHVIEPRVRVIEIRGLDQKAYPNYDPGASTSTGIDPGYERRTGIDRLGKANEATYYLTNILNAKTVAGPDQTPVRWEMVRFTLSQTYKMDPIAQPFKDLYGDLTYQPNQRIGFHADARYNVYNLGLREANADIRLIYPRVSVAVGPRFNEQANTQYLRAETLVKVLNNLDVRGATSWDVLKGRAIENRIGVDWRFSCWSVSAEYVNRHNDESEFRIMVNLLGVGQVGTSARAGF